VRHNTHAVRPDAPVQAKVRGDHGHGKAASNRDSDNKLYDFLHDLNELKLL
jgi:hypothetical protein